MKGGRNEVEKEGGGEESIKKWERRERWEGEEEKEEEEMKRERERERKREEG